MDGRKIPNWECLFVHREKGLFLSVYVDDIKLAGKKQNLDPMWLREILRIQKSTSGGTLCIFGKHTFVPKKLEVQETNCRFEQFDRI